MDRFRSREGKGCGRTGGFRLALGGQILTRPVFDEARLYVREHPPAEGHAERPGLEWMAHGPYLMKGNEEPVEVFEVGACELAPLRPPPDSDKAVRSVAADDAATLGWRPASGLEIPRRHGWRLTGKLGEGGFGEVWLAQQVRTRELRVFKFCFDPVRLRSFKRELTLFRLIRDALGKREDMASLLPPGRHPGSEAGAHRKATAGKKIQSQKGAWTPIVQAPSDALQTGIIFPFSFSSGFCPLIYFSFCPCRIFRWFRCWHDSGGRWLSGAGH